MSRQIAVIGLGLIGGSIAMGLKEFEDFKRVGVDVSQPTLRYALEQGIVDQVCEDPREALAQADLVFLCDPNNPTGRRMEPELLWALLDRCRAVGAFLAVDQCFLELTEGDPDALVSQLTGGGLLLLRALTKSCALAGLRLGYCLCGDRALLERMEGLGSPWPVSAPAQAAGVCAFLDFPDWPERCLPFLREERARLTRTLEALGLWVCPSDANFILFQGPTDLGERLLQEKDILIRDCANYSGLGPGWYRIGIQKRDGNSRLIQALVELCG